MATTTMQPGPRRRGLWPAFLVLLVGLVATGCLGLAAAAAQQANEARLLRQRIGEAALVVTAGVPAIQTPLAAGAELVDANDGNPAAFRELMQPEVGPTAEFSSASLWVVGQAHPKPVVVVGLAPDLARESPAQISAFLTRAATTPALLTVVSHLGARPPALGYSYRPTGSHTRFVVYAERTLRQNRETALGEDPAFADVNYAVYFGTSPNRTSLLSTTTNRLPLRGRHVVEHVPRGDAELLLVMTPKSVLGGRLLLWLPWLIGGLGSLLSITFATLVTRLLRRQRETARLAADNAELYADQRSVAQTLQLSLLPQSLPQSDRVEFGVRYQAGVDGIDIGGDWYDVIPLEDGRVLAVMGDVSGRGLGAATVMASLRYAIRAFASQGDDPVSILEQLNGVIDLERDGHFATILLVQADLATGAVVVASAGHPQPLLIDREGVRFVDIQPGAPVGIGGAAPSSVSMQVAAEATLLLYTDGLFERRGEVLDTGLDRLRASAGGPAGSLDDLLSRIIRDLATSGGHDDTALLGMRWLN